jgi:hypothetical protein
VADKVAADAAPVEVVESAGAAVADAVGVNVPGQAAADVATGASPADDAVPPPDPDEHPTTRSSAARGSAARGGAARGGAARVSRTCPP